MLIHQGSNRVSPYMFLLDMPHGVHETSFLIVGSQGIISRKMTQLAFKNKERRNPHQILNQRWE